jgi:negative regulator of flagellin synthesis FlgM
MKIHDTNIPTPQALSSYSRGDAARAGAEKPAGGGVSAPRERIELSGGAKDALQLRRAVDEAPEIREDRVNELKARIDSGTYRVSSGDIASRMVGDSLLDLIR